MSLVSDLESQQCKPGQVRATKAYFQRTDFSGNPSEICWFFPLLFWLPGPRWWRRGYNMVTCHNPNFSPSHSERPCKSFDRLASWCSMAERRSTKLHIELPNRLVPWSIWQRSNHLFGPTQRLWPHSQGSGWLPSPGFPYVARQDLQGARHGANDGANLPSSPSCIPLKSGQLAPHWRRIHQHIPRPGSGPNLQAMTWLQ